MLLCMTSSMGDTMMLWSTPMGGRSSCLRLTGFPSLRPHRLFDDLLGQLLMLQVLEIRRQLLRQDRFHQRAHLGIAQLPLGLPLELRVFHHRQHHGGHALAEVVAA